MSINETTYEKGFDPLNSILNFIDYKLADACLETIDNMLDKTVTDLKFPSENKIKRELWIATSARDHFQTKNGPKTLQYVKAYDERISIMEELLKKSY